MANYEVEIEREPLIGDVSTDDTQMREQLVHWLDENNLGNQDSISITTLRGALKGTALKAGHNEERPGVDVAEPTGFGVNTHCCTVAPKALQNCKLYLGIAVFILIWLVCGIIFLFTVPVIGIIVALSIEGAALLVCLFLGAYWWGRRGPPLTDSRGQYLELPIKATTAEYYA